MATWPKPGIVGHDSDTAAPDVPNYAVRHYAPAEIAELWSLSVDSVRKIFENEPGVLVIGNSVSGRRRRSYTTLRIPQQVVERVHRRLSKV
jgi:hypothetical protein